MPVDNIIIPALSLAFPAGAPVTFQNGVSFSLNFTLTGGSFSITALKDSIMLPTGKNTPVSLPFGRIGLLRDQGINMSRSGLVSSVSGIIIPLVASQTTIFSMPPPPAPPPGGTTSPPTFPMSVLAKSLALGAVSWETADYQVRGFAYSGVALQGVQGIASLALADIIVGPNVIYVVAAGNIINGTYSVATSDLVSLNQSVDYSRVTKAVLNPAFLFQPINFEGDFIYDDQHTNKQGNTTVQIGSPGGTGSTDFIPIPDGWLVEGTFEEWQPPLDPLNPTDLTNSNKNAEVNQLGTRYWKTFPSPSGGGLMRGILTFTRLVKDLNLPGNISTFVGTPITQETQGGSNTIALQNTTSENGITGFHASDTLVSDIVTGQPVSVKNAMELIPNGGDSGLAHESFHSVQFGLWLFPRVVPQILFEGPATNPLNIPRDTAVVTPPGNVVATNFDGSSNGFGQFYLQQYKIVNSARLVTAVSFLYRGGTQLPLPGQGLSIAAARYPDCGRISSVTFNVSRSGVLVQVSAEKFNFNANG